MPYIPLQVSIPEPCHEKWEEMTPQPDGRRHCASCSRNLVDFSYMTDREIHQFLRTNQGSICGRWRKDQLQRPILAEVPKRKGLRAAATVGGLLIASGLGAQVMEAPTSRGQVAVEEVLVGEVGPVEEITPSSQSLNDPIKIKGSVRDTAGEPLIAVVILIEGTTIGTVTDFEGQFELEMKPGQEVLFSYVGYDPQKFSFSELKEVEGGHRLDVVLQEGSMRLEEPMILGRIAMPEAPEPEITEEELSLIDQSREAASAYLTQAEFFPNPVDDFIGVRFESATATSVIAQLFDFEGRILRTWARRDLAEGPQTEKFGIRYLNLPAGHYYLNLTDASGHVETRVVVKE
ncbi:MAG: carboxypeptidase-like regulatory domain-containing protein [Bacteroidota bacterium]